MATRIHDLALSTPVMLATFSDEILISCAISFEEALAEASASERLIPKSAATAIRRAGTEMRFHLDAEEIADEAAHAGTLAIPVVMRLREFVSRIDPAAAEFVHRGATSQDLADTALMLQVRSASVWIPRDGGGVANALAALAEAHAGTPMLGRTLMQPARPITFGLKAAELAAQASMAPWRGSNARRRRRSGCSWAVRSARSRG